jgi:hypothetical protein
VPDLGRKLHDRRPEGILIGYLYVDFVLAALICSPWWPFERPSKSRDIIPDRLRLDVRVCVIMDIRKFFVYPPCLVGGHDSRSSVLAERPARSRDAKIRDAIPWS